MKVLTVCVAICNVEPYIDECLASLADDRFTGRLEVLVVDDGSTDGTAAAAKRYAEARPEIFTYLYKTNGGWGSVLNHAIPRATGRYFKQLDGDDLFDTEALAELLDALETAEADLVLTNFSVFTDATGVARTVGFEGDPPLGRTVLLDELEREPVPLPQDMHALTVSTELLASNAVTLTERCYYTDVEFWIKAVSLANSFLFLPLDVYRYRVGRSGQSVSIEGMRAHHAEHRAVLETCIRYTESRPCRGFRADALRDRLGTMLEKQYTFYLALPPSPAVRDELARYDAWVRRDLAAYPTKRSRKVNLLRATGLAAYRPLAWYTRHRLG
jgi:glycosyltransferase involved in cell wall biosynthesis